MLYDRRVLQLKLDILLSFFCTYAWLLVLIIDIKAIQRRLLIIKMLKIKLFGTVEKQSK